MVEDMDFYGGDLGSIFNTTLDACQSACVGDRSCRAFTYNTRSSACFLKSGFDEMRVFEGALSGRVIEVAPEALALAEQRATDLGFLPEGYLDQAQTFAAGLGARFPADSRTEAELMGVKNFGQTSLTEIDEKLINFGLGLRSLE